MRISSLLRRGRTIHPLLLAVALIAVCGSGAVAALLFSPDRPAHQLPPPSQAEPAGACPAGGDRAQRVALRAARQKEEGKGPENPEGSGSKGCVGCHRGIEPSHARPEVAKASCVDCHGGDGYATTKEAAHVRPRFPARWGKKGNHPFTGNPAQTYTLLNDEKPEFIRFINPGDLRVAEAACGSCHRDEVRHVRKSMMATDGMLWGAALYNNGSFPLKNTRYGESYSPKGEPQRVQGYFTDERGNVRLPTAEETMNQGLLPFLDPLPRWEITQVGNVLRAFERGGEKKSPLDVGNPKREEDAGKPDIKLSFRGHGTLLRTDPVYLGLQKTRLFDPTLNFLGTNDQPGDYHSSGCTTCHNVYANDADDRTAGPYAKYGHWGESSTKDEAMQYAVEHKERGHPINHTMVRAMPTSQCMACHIHPGGNMVTTYMGMIWWDNETDGEVMYPKQPLKLTADEKDRVQRRNPEGSAIRGKWNDVNFLAQTGTEEFNKQLKQTQFGDFHSHGWVLRKVYKHDRKGNLLDSDNNVITEQDPQKKFDLAVHLQDIHLRRGMQCVDCHFRDDVHGDGRLYGESRAAVKIDCIDCHGTVQKHADLVDDLKGDRTARRASKNPLLPYNEIRLGTEKEKPRWSVDPQTNELTQFTALDGLAHRVPQVVESINPKDKEHYNPLSRWAKLVTTAADKIDTDAVPDDKDLAHGNSKMTCYACHSSWTSSCFGCHLSMRANQKKPNLHNEGGDTRNWTQYNFQTLRDDAYMLGRDGTVTGGRVCPVRSSCAVLVSSQNQNREWIYQQQQTVSAEGLSGTAFSSYAPHTVGGKGESKVCTDCHLSKANDNNAWLANLVLHGTNFYNFIGRYAFVATGAGFNAVVVTEREEPQAVIGSTLHRLAFPDMFAQHEKRGRELKRAFEHTGRSLWVERRGEYLYSAEGPGGLVVYDVANVDNKGFSERLTTAPVSPLGQRFYVKSKYATCVVPPATLAIDPARTHFKENQELLASLEDETNTKKQPRVHPLYAYLYVTDKYEGLILVNAATLLDGDPTNNFLKRALTWNPAGILDGASHLQIAGNFAYVTCDRGLVIVDLTDPLKPKVAAEVGSDAGGKGKGLNHPRAVAVQLRYVFVVDDDGLKVIRIQPSDPSSPELVEGAVVPLKDANDVYVVRSYAYVADGRDGLAIVDVENPEKPALDQIFDAGGKLNDCRAVRTGMTNNSLYAYVADGKNGLRVLQMLSPDMTPGIYGFSPRPTPQLIATFRTKEPALAVAEGLDRDRAVDESGNQLSVFGRRGARPFTSGEVKTMLLVDPTDPRDPKQYPPDVPPVPPPAAAFRWPDFLLTAGILAIPFLIRRRRPGE